MFFNPPSGLSLDLESSSSSWKLLHDAREPDNLPLHEPWYSRVDRAKRVLVIGAIRPDKLPELVYSFVSDNIG